MVLWYYGVEKLLVAGCDAFTVHRLLLPVSVLFILQSNYGIDVCGLQCRDQTC